MKDLKKAEVRAREVVGPVFVDKGEYWLQPSAFEVIRGQGETLVRVTMVGKIVDELILPGEELPDVALTEKGGYCLSLGGDKVRLYCNEDKGDFESAAKMIGRLSQDGESSKEMVLAFIKEKLESESA